MMKKITTSCLISTLAMLLSACGSSDSTPNEEEKPPQNPVVVVPDPNFQKPVVPDEVASNGYLINLKTPTAVHDYLLNQTIVQMDYADALNKYYEELYNNGAVGDPVPSTSNPRAPSESSSETDNASSGGDSPLSSTNTYEKGVGEADIVKHIDNNVFIAKKPHYYAENVDLTESTDIHVYQVDAETAETQRLSDVTFGTDFQLEELYTHSSDKAESLLIALGTQRQATNRYYGKGMQEDGDVATSVIWQDTYYWEAVNTHISTVDVTNVEDMKVNFDFTIEGNTVDTRMVDNKLYVVSRHHPKMTDNFHKTFQSYRTLKEVNGITPETLANIKVVLYEELSKSNIAPEVKVNLQTAKPAYDLESCFISMNEAEAFWNSTITTVTTIDLNDTSKIEYQCLASPVEGFYASKNAMYFTSSKRDGINTIIHQLSYTDTGVTYAGSGEFEGSFGWGKIGYKMSEYDGYVRLISEKLSSWGCWEMCAIDGPAVVVLPEERNGKRTAFLSPVRPYASPFDVSDYVLMTMKLNPSTMKLELVDTYPRIVNSAIAGNRIGKVGERLHGFRFDADKAYAVTFRQTDPLYAFDLSDPENIRMTGELEIPGFSDYLHPMGENLVVGVGSENNFLKVSLYDMSEENDIKVLKDYILNDGQSYYSYSTATFNHHAFSYVKVGESVTRFALPFMQYRNQRNVYGLALFEVNTDTQALVKHKFIELSENDARGYGYNIDRDRSILSEAAIFYVHDDALTGYLWSEYSGDMNDYEQVARQAEAAMLKHAIDTNSCDTNQQCIVQYYSAGYCPSQPSFAYSSKNDNEAAVMALLTKHNKATQNWRLNVQTFAPCPDVVFPAIFSAQGQCVENRCE